MHHLTPESIQGWLNTLTTLITGGGTIGLLLITTIFMLLKAIKDKQTEISALQTATTAKLDSTKGHVDENFGTLNALVSRVDRHGAALAAGTAKPAESPPADPPVLQP